MSPWSDSDGSDGLIPVADRRVKRTPAMLEAAGVITRVAEWACVLVVSLFGIWLTFDTFALQPIDQYVRVAWLSSVFYALAAELVGCYDVDVRFALRQGWMRVLVAWIGCCVAMLTLAFFVKVSESFSRGWTAVWVISVGTGLILVRSLAATVLRRLKRKGVFNQRVAIFGPVPQVGRLTNYIRSNRELTIDLTGRYGDGAAPIGDGDQLLPYRGGLSTLLADIRAGRIDQVIVAMPLEAGQDVEEIVGRLALLPVLIRLAPDVSSFALAGRSMVMLGDLPLMTLFERPINGTDQLAKRAEDLVIGSVLLLAFLPLLAIIAIAVKLDSRGPVFFRQPREGFNHQTFRIWKFRSMAVTTLQYDDIQQASIGDRRVTRVGRLLRGSSLDELPQLINVVRGEMSLVGPRPHAPSTRVEGVLFSEATQNYAARHRVKPGMTGWAQVNGWRGETDTDEKLLKRVEFDLYYIEHWSIWFDIYILFRTITAVMFPKSAY